jgi:hypothetical protein
MSEKPATFLTDDVVTVPGQMFALLSVVGPTANQKTDKWGLKIRGVFNTRQEAQEHVKRIQEIDGNFDVYLVDMYKWLLFPPDPTQIDDVNYQENFLNDLVRGHYENQKKAKQVFEERKHQVMMDGLDKHLLPEERIAPPAGIDTFKPAFGAQPGDPATVTDLEKTMQAPDPGPSGSST